MCPSPIRVTLTPERTTIRPGQNLIFTARVENTTNERHPYTVWLDAFRSDGKPFQGNPVFGPRSGFLRGGRVLEQRVPLRIPSDAPPSGPHLLRLVSGEDGAPCAVSSFEVTIVR